MPSSSIIKINGANQYTVLCRYWEAENPSAIIVLVHGVVSHSLWLEQIAQALALKGISCLAMDRRGAGLNSESRGDAPNATALLEDLRAVMDFAHTQSTPVHLCGFCWGANYVVNYINTYRQAVNSTILLAPSLFPTRRITDRPFHISESHVPTEEPTMPVECFTDGPMYESFILPDPLRLKRVSPRMNSVMSEFSRGIWMKFLRIEVPTLVMLGMDDEVVDNNATQNLFNRLGVETKRLVTVPAKHGIQFDTPDTVVDTLFSWVLTLDTPGIQSQEF